MIYKGRERCVCEISLCIFSVSYGAISATCLSQAVREERDNDFAVWEGSDVARRNNSVCAYSRGEWRGKEM